MKTGAKSLGSFEDRAKRMSRNVAKAGAAVAAGLTVAAAGAFKLAKSAAEAGAEIERMARISGTTPVQFQKFAAAARTVGIENEKLSDIFKDMQDRVGDFLETGGGPMADFFENIAPKVGVTAENFKELSGPEALQLYVRSLQQAGLNQNQMTFYLEAMASDASALIPILKDNGAELQRLGEEAEAAGRIMSNEAVAGASQLNAELSELGTELKTQLFQAILENKDEIRALADVMTGVVIPAIAAVVGAIGDIVSAINKAIEAYQRFKSAFTGENWGGVADSAIRGSGLQSGDQGPRAPSSTGTHPIDDFILDGLNGQGGTPSIRFGPSSSIQGGGPELLRGGGGMGFVQGGAGSDLLGLPFGEFEQEALRERQEVILDILREGFAARQEVTTEALQADADLKQEYADADIRREEITGQAKLQAVGAALGDLSSLMTTNNEKLFKIGKAAAIAEATVSGYQAAAKAWQLGMNSGGPPVAMAFTAASLARTGALISSIQSQQIGGGAGVAAGGGAAAASAAQADQGQFINVSLTGGPNFGAQQIDELFEMFNKHIEDGGIIRGVRRV